MECDPSQADRINSFALVSYVPDRLGDFLNGLRRELVQGCFAQSHVTILPPRPIDVNIPVAEEEARGCAELFPPFEVTIADVRIFPVSDVIYAEIRGGREQLGEMHEALNRNALAFDEPFDYHPHITLAQNIEPSCVQEAFELALRRWEEIPSRTFVVETLTFVQNTIGNRWMNLSSIELKGAAELRGR